LPFATPPHRAAASIVGNPARAALRFRKGLDHAAVYSGCMKVLAVSYSYTGRCRKLRQALAARLGWAEGEITDRSPGRAAWRCILDSLLRRRPRIRYTGPALDNFDAVVLIAPIWARKLASPMRTFASNRWSQIPTVALVTVMGGDSAPDALAEVTRLLGQAPVVFATFTQSEVDDGSFAAHIEALGRSLEQARDAMSVPPNNVLAQKAA
jgi:hypothetical protein